MTRHQKINFATVILSHLGEVSSTSFRGEDLNKVLDHLYGLLHPYLDSEKDKRLWVDNVQTEDSYAYMMNKIRICMIILYRTGMLPKVKYENRVYEEQILAGTSYIDGESIQVAEKIFFKELLLSHLMSFTTMYKQGMDFNLEMHVDLLWMYLTPYITYEDSELWDTNYDLHGSNPVKHDKYYFIERKKRICMDVMDRADFLWSRSAVDVDEISMDDRNVLEDIGYPKLPPNKDNDNDEDHDYFEYSELEVR